MVNIIVDHSKDVVSIENKDYNLDNIYGESDKMMLFLKDMLDKVYYSGETICLEVRHQDGNYEEIDRWK